MAGEDMNKLGKDMNKGKENPPAMPLWRKILRIFSKTLLWVAGIWLAVLVIVQVVVSEPVLRQLITKFASPYVDGEISYSTAYINVFRHFPSFDVTVEDFNITYQPERFDSSEVAGVQGFLAKSGTGETADTLASFKEFTASLNVFALAFGNVRVPRLSLVRPRIFLHEYADGKSNLDVFNLSEENDADGDVESESVDSTSTTLLNEISLGKIALTDRPLIVYTDSKDTVFAMLNLSSMRFDGRLSGGKLNSNDVTFDIDSLFVAGRLGCDTLSLGVDKLRIAEDGDQLGFLLESKALMAFKSLGRFYLPVSLSGKAAFDFEGEPEFWLNDFSAQVGPVPLKADVYARMVNGDSLYVKASAHSHNCSISKVVNDFMTEIIPEVSKVKTDALVSLNLECDGYYLMKSGGLPRFEVGVSIPKSNLSYDFFKDDVSLELAARADNKKDGCIVLNLEKASVKTDGLSLEADAVLNDVLGADPGVNLCTNLRADFDKLSSYLPDSLDVDAKGVLDVSFVGSARMSQLNLYNFSKAKFEGVAKASDVNLSALGDSLKFFMNNMDLKLSPVTKKSKKGEKFTVLALSGAIDTASFNYEGGFGFNARDVAVNLTNSTESISDTTKISPLGITLEAGKIAAYDGDGMVAVLADTDNRFLLVPNRENSSLPIMNITSQNGKIILRSDNNRLILSGGTVKARAEKVVPRQIRRKQRQLPDSLSRKRYGNLPAWLSDEDFRKQDLDFRLDDALLKYMKEWNFNGSMKVSSGVAMTPYFPLRNIIQGVDCKFDNDKIELDKFWLRSGDSDILFKGNILGLRRVLQGRGILKADLNLKSNRLDGDQLFNAYALGSRYEGDDSESLSSVSDEEFMEQIVVDSLPAKDSSSGLLLVVPANVDVNVSIDANNVSYSTLSIPKFMTDLYIKERCVQLTNTSIFSNVGDIHFDGFYSTQTKQDVKAGFSLNLSDVTAENVISLLPAIDTLMPVLKSFNGLINCDLAATTNLDEEMNILFPSMNGILRITGDDMSIKDSEMFRDLARKLLFKNKVEGHVDHMSIEAMISDGKLEVFPFVFQMDRYALAMSGFQNIDESFRYHVSLIKSPFLIRLGVDIYGDNFDDMKFKIGRAKFRSTNVPVFSSVIDRGRTNLVESIRNVFDRNVDKVMKGTETVGMIEQYKKDISYVNAAENEIQALSSREEKELKQQQDQQENESKAVVEAANVAEDQVEDDVDAAVNDILGDLIPVDSKPKK